MQIQRDGRTGAEESITSAFRNQLIIRHLFGYLSHQDLKASRCVNKFWNFEVSCILRDYRQCFARLSEGNLCSDLEKLNDVLSRTIVCPINGVRIDNSVHPHSVCKFAQKSSVIQAFESVRKHMVFQSLHLNCKLSALSKCRAIEMLEDVRRLRICSHGFLDSFAEDWNPRMPKLQILDVVDMNRVSNKSFIKVVEGAQGLLKIKGNFCPEDIHQVPTEKCRFLDTFDMYIHSEQGCATLSMAQPGLSKLRSYGFVRQYEQVFFQAVQCLLRSSFKTLVQLQMANVMIPFTELSFPPLMVLESLVIRTHESIEEILKVIEWTNKTMLPALRKVEIREWQSANFTGQGRITPYYNENPPFSSPASSVNTLIIAMSSFQVPYEKLSLTFPNITELVLQNLAAPVGNTLYSALWACWPHLELLDITENAGALRRNCDAAFIGIHRKELKFLLEEDASTLEMMNIVPTRPSLLTMSSKVLNYAKKFITDCKHLTLFFQD